MKIDTSILKNKKNLLAFSAGVDSTALFFILLENNIPFDIAIVDYNSRSQSKLEIKYAQDLATKYKKECYIKEVQLSHSNFEKNARDIRYKFFESLISSYQYDNLITAHQLNDKLEWFLMQFSKGAGLVELIGLNEFELRNNYNLVRPILNLKKTELLNYLQHNNIKYFTDNSNFDDKYKRNYFRKNFSNEFLEEFSDGITRSFTYLNKDIISLEINALPILKKDELEIFVNHQDNNKNIRIIDKNLKQRGLIITNKQREEILKQKTITVSNKIVISITQKYLWIAPTSISIMDKNFKELCRIHKIPKNIRPYLNETNVNINEIMKQLVF